MITDPPAPEPASRRWSGLLRVMTARPRRAGLGEHMRTLSIGGRIVRVAVREGNPDWPPLLLCNGIGPAWSCSSRSSTRWIRSGASSGSTCRAPADPRRQ